MDEKVWNEPAFRKANPGHVHGELLVYVGLNGLDPDLRFDRHKAGVQANRYVREYGLRLLPTFYEVDNPMPYHGAGEMEVELRHCAARSRLRGLAGLTPACGRVDCPMRSHDLHDRRSLALHRLVAARIAADPSLLERARATLDRWRPTMSRRAMPYLDAWQAILGSGVEGCIAVLLDESERGDALRQTSPFAGVLSPRERSEFFKQWRDIAEAATE